MKKTVLAITALALALAASAQTAPPATAPDSVDCDYCLDLKEDKAYLRIVKQYSELTVQTAKAGEEPTVCETDPNARGEHAEIDIIDESGKKIQFRGWAGAGSTYGYCADCAETLSKGPYPLPREIEAGNPGDMSLWSYHAKEKNGEINKTLLRYKGKIVDGYKTVSIGPCEPYGEPEYRIKFRAGITGECGRDFLKKREATEGSWKSGAATVTWRNDSLIVSGDGAMKDYNPDFFEALTMTHHARTSSAVLAVEKGVTHIGNHTFCGVEGVKSVTMANSVTSIGENAFEYCEKLKHVTLPQSLTSIGNSAFGRCHGLTSVTIPNGVTFIGEGAFAHCLSLTSIKTAAENTRYRSEGGVLFNRDKTALIQYPAGRRGPYAIPRGVTRIAGMAFAGSNALTSVTIPNSVTAIGSGAFLGCDSLKSITVPNGAAIGDSAFWSCAGLKSVTIGNGAASIGKEAFWNCVYLTSVTIGDGVTSIGEGAFLGCGMNSVTLPNSVTSIGEMAFMYSGLTSVTIPSGVTSVGEGAFASCDKLASIDVAADNARYSSDGGVLFNKDKTALIQYPPNRGRQGRYAIPGGVTSIGKGAFAKCDNLTSVTIPSGVTEIGGKAFAWCRGLTSVTVPNGVTSIGEEAFFYCDSLKSVTIPNSVTSIGDGAFIWCAALTSVTIPKKISSIGKAVFEGCRALTSVVIPSGVTSIGEGAFAYSGLASVAIPGGVTSIGRNAFARCTSLTSVTLPNSVTSIDRGAFSRCINLKSAVLSNRAKSVSGYMFYECTTLTSVTIPNGVASVIEKAFYNCRALQSITLPASVAFIGKDSFYGCRSLKSITVRSPSPPKGAVAFEGVYDEALYAMYDSAALHVPKGSIDAYRVADGWKKFKNILPIME